MTSTFGEISNKNMSENSCYKQTPKQRLLFKEAISYQLIIDVPVQKFTELMYYLYENLQYLHKKPQA